MTLPPPPPLRIHVHLRFSPAKVLPVLSSSATRWKSARLHGGVMLQLLSAPLQNGLRFFQHPLPATPSAFLADAPAFTGRRNVGFAMFCCDDMNELAPAYTPAVFLSVCAIKTKATPDCIPFGSSLSASLARPDLRCLWQFTCVGHFIQPHLSDRIDARSHGDHLAAVSSSRRWRDVVSAASDPTVTSRADADRLLRTEPQVRLMNLPFISNHHHNHFISHVFMSAQPCFHGLHIAHALDLRALILRCVNFVFIAFQNIVSNPAARKWRSLVNALAIPNRRITVKEM